MKKPLRLLHIEDSESDAELILRLLEKAGYGVDTRRIEEGDEMRTAIVGQTWDLIIADHNMARFDSPSALKILHESGLDIPFIVVSGSIGEEIAVDLMKSGAHDYVLKDKLARLAPAVERELREAASRRDRRIAERELRESEERLALAVKATQLGTFDLSPTTGKLVWSDATYGHFGLITRPEVSYETFERGLHAEDRERVLEAVQKLLVPGADGQYAIEYRTVGIEDRVERQILALGRVFYDGEGQAVRFVGVTLDVSERKRLEDQLRQAQKLESVGRLAGGIAHDFNNLLTVINGYSDMLMEELPAEDPSYRYCKEIRAAGGRGAALTAQLLAMNRKHAMRTQEVNLNEIVLEVTKMLGRVMEEKVRVERILSPSLGRVLADSGQLHQVLMNLAVNGRDAMPSGGTLSFETGNTFLREDSICLLEGMAAGRYVQLTVRDTGIGMTPAVMAHLFEPFFTTKKVGEGTGLGLATVYGIVRRIGGSIQVDSAPGEGTTFAIYLPLIEAGPDVFEEPSVRALRGTETILVVEDQEQVRTLAGTVLRAYGYHVLEAGHPGEALLCSERYTGSIHLLLSDVVMPEMTGPELADRIKSTRPGIRVVLMSGYSDQVAADGQRLESKGDYLAKPFSPQELACKMRNALDTAAEKGSGMGGSN